MANDDESVNTEPQRAALEEMSQALLAGLNAMVAEQERRAAEFAARTHSLSALPEQAPLPQVEPAAPLPQVEPAVAPAEPAVARPAARRVQPPPGAKPEPTPPPKQQWTSAPPKPRRVEPSHRFGAGDEKSSVGSGWVVFVIFAIYIIIRFFCN